MERSTGTKATSDETRLNRVRMARALREGAGAEDGRGAEQRMAGVERNRSADSGLRRVGARVTLGVLLASTLTGGRIPALRADFLRHAAAGGGQGGSIPGSPGPSVGSDGQSHSPIQDTNQEQQKKMFSKLTGVTAAIAVGASVTVAGAQNAAVQWKVEDGGNGHWYELRELPARPTCSLAASMAHAIGARLIALETSSENEFFNSLRCSQSTQHLSAWQDLSIVNGVWVWGSGETLAFHSWSPGQPDGGWTATIDWSGPLGQCDSLTWGDESCDSGNLPSSLFVEWSADCNGDSIVDYGQCLDGTLSDLNSNNIPDCCESGTSCEVTRFVPAKFPSIQAAIDAAFNGDRIVVASGTYREQVNLRGKGVQLVSVDGPESTIIDGEGTRTVIVGNGEPPTCSITGFTIKNGFASGYNVGGGIQLSNSSARVVNCRISNNRVTGYAWWSGGGAYTVGGAPVFEECDFEGNEVAPTENIHAASALYHYVGGSIMVKGCRFHGNVTRSLGGTYQPQAGCQVKVQSEFQPTTAVFERCAFYDNRSTGTLPVVLGQVELSQSSLSSSFDGCTFVGNGAMESLVIWTGDGQDNRVTDSAICGFGQVSNSGGSAIAITNTTVRETCVDCDNDGIADQLQIFADPSLDSDLNGLMDGCEQITDCNKDGINDETQVARGQLPDYDGNNIPDCCDRGEACVVGSYPVQWRTADGGNGHWYMLQRNGSYLCWSTASAFAQSNGGYLVSETTKEEHSFVSGRLVVRDDAWSGRWGPWIGGLYAGGRWTWTSGEPWNFTAWHPGEPNSGGLETVVSYIAPGGAGDCGRTTMWNDWVDCATVQASGCDVGVWNYVIEWSADCNNDGTVDYGQILRGDLPDINHNGTPDTCECIGDIYVDRAINGADLGALLAYWGPTTSAAASRACDLNGDGVVSGSDLGALLAYWGPCSN